MIKGVLWLVVAAFVGTIFLVWGRGRDVSRTDMAAIVNERVITLRQYYDEYQNLEGLYREIYGNLPNKDIIDSDNLKREALDNLIDRELFREAADKMNINVSDEEVQYAISTNPAFSQNGQFDRQRYLTILRTNSITPKDYEGQMKVELRLRKLQGFIQSTVKISEKEIKDRFVTLKREIRLKYATIEPASMTVEPPKKEEIERYYADNRELFRLPVKTKVEYAIFRAEKFTGKVTVTDAEISTFYDANQDRYLAPEQRRFYEIVLPYKDGSATDSMMERARKIRDELVSGIINFEEGIEKYSAIKRKQNGGEKKWYGKSDLPQQMANTAFSLPVDGITDPVNTGSAVKLLKVAEIKRSEPYPLEKVREKVIADLKREKSQDLAIIKAYEAKGRLSKGEEFAGVMADYSLPVLKTAFVSYDEVEESLRDVISSSYLLLPGETGEVKKSGDNHIVYRLLERKDSSVRPMAEVEVEITKRLEEKSKYKKALATAEKIIEEAKKEKGLTKVARKHNLSLKTTPYFSPLSSPGIPGIPLSPTMGENVLALGKTDSIADNPLSTGEKIFILEFAGEKEISLNDYEKNRGQIANILLEQKKAAALQAFIKEQRDKSKIEISTELNLKKIDSL